HQFRTLSQNSVVNAIEDINRISQSIATLNAEIRARQTTGQQPNDLLDLRDQAVQELSLLADVDTYRLGDGSIGVYMNQFPMVDASGARPLPTTYDAATQTLTDANGTYEVRGGTLAGLFQSIVAVEDSMRQLDTLANTLRTEFNSVHITGTNLNGTSGIRFFNDSTPPNPQSGAIDFDLSAEVRADTSNIAAGVSGAAGDGGLALSLSRLRDTSLTALGDRTFNRFYSDLLGQIGRDSAYYRSARDTQVAVIEQIDQQIQSVSGVSLDDEMANLMKFQRSYQAAAKALTVFDQMTEDLIGMLRR
ncbi:MAG TPA: flagellar hook-associated protein FlgK, partial [Fimbriimonadaceae bacterium]|nr:flagellar hook-associated protein FlgK [Fimbriimonadaceae bacterium]